MLALKELDTRRMQRISSVGNNHKEKFAQYLTPVEIASFMAKITMRYFRPADVINILDPGAGTGILSCSLITEIAEKSNAAVNLDAYEIDGSILSELEQSYKTIQSIKKFNYQIFDNDFIADVGSEIARGDKKKYDVIIMNPPYRKINTNTVYKNVLHDISIDTVNTYSAFIAIGIKMLADNGILTAIVPRSFCNGLYFLPFRRLLYDNTAIKHLHIFESRRDNFKEENVLQENIIIVLKKTADKSGNVTVSYSKEKHFAGFLEKDVTLDDVINTGDAQCYISIPNYSGKTVDVPLTHTHKELGFEISTGPVVDFRVKEKLRYDTGGVPLLYAVHIRNCKITWPVVSRKPNAIFLDEQEKEKICFKKGYYILLKRFTTKEEKHRIQAALLTPDDLSAEYFTVENHLNIIHNNKHGLDKDLAVNLVVYLNSDYCDAFFRTFSGHTQVNATDLRNMKYPDVETMRKWSV
ncbi:MAG: Eco57I restriction-modification methylase domain-containing protein [Treponema sp.]|jgi:adenine-specific DNA-methyltransferase|nr:Eco57I restriction-modification methylase domain-containing protein [Treponema sp.]